MKPNKGTYNDYFQQYIDLVSSDNLLEELKNIHDTTQKTLSKITEEKSNYRYAEGKWSIKELVLHCIDCERVFQYRAMSFARNDKTALPGFEEDDYVLHSNADTRRLKDIAYEFQTVRNATISLFKGLDTSVLDNGGIANGAKLTVNACGFIICGHELHHMKVLKERYL